MNFNQEDARKAYGFADPPAIEEGYFFPIVITKTNINISCIAMATAKHYKNLGNSLPDKILNAAAKGREGNMGN